MDIGTLAEQVRGHYENHGSNLGGIVRPLDGMVLLRKLQTTPLDATLYNPVACLILQGAKETIAGDTKVKLAAGDALVVSHDLPIRSRITVASPENPYLAVVLTIDLVLLRSLYDEVGDCVDAAPTTSSLAAHRADPTLVDSVSRYLALSDDPLATRVLLPQLRREVHFRLLMAPHGGMLRQLLRHDSHASRVTQAIAHLRKNFATSIPVSDLAREVGMSTSSLHKHFKAVTATSPLQYQKNLRLLEARKLLGTGADSVSAVAYSVGYESPNQFSREYGRKFGVPPREHLAQTDLGR